MRSVNVAHFENRPRKNLISIEINQVDGRTSLLEILREPGRLWVSFSSCVTILLTSI